MRALIRADAGPRIGSGHLMRCLALAQSCEERGIDPTFATAALAPGFESRLREEGLGWTPISHTPGSPRDAEETRELAAAIGASWVVVDGYQFDALYQLVVGESGARVLAIDDFGHAGAYVADLVLNQNLHARAEMYPDVASHTRLLLGTAYALLRREFIRARGRAGTASRGRKVLIAMGGGDPAPTVGAIHALAAVGIDEIEAVVVVGPSNAGSETIEAAVQASHLSVRMQTNVLDMPELMHWADVAVASAGTISWELAFMGVPFVAVVLAENQREVAAGLDREGVAVNVGWWSRATPELLAQALGKLMADAPGRRRMSARGRAIVDGRGADRVVERMLAPADLGRGSEEGGSEEQAHPGEGRLRIRDVRADDRVLLWQWANDPAVRAASFRSDRIPWETHARWFETRGADASCSMYIVENDRGPTGQVRFTRSGAEAEVHVSMAAGARGRGLGGRAIRLACDRHARDAGPGRIVAHVKPGNVASVRAFEAAGFKRRGEVSKDGGPAIELVRDVGDSVL